jgi:hypothetical protein
MKTTTLIAGGLAAALSLLNPAISRAEDHNGTVKKDPRTVIEETIRTEVGRQLKEAGANYEGLQVTVARNQDSGTPFKVSYQGLHNFGDALEPDGEFTMEYIGGAQWQGKLADKEFTVQVGHTDNIDLPFVNDPEVIGEWKSVDFVAEISDFNPDKHSWAEDKLFLKSLTFLDDGKMDPQWLAWTKGVVMHHGDKTASRYEIKQLNGKSYLFFEWKSGDVTISGMKPHYYVLSK